MEKEILYRQVLKTILDVSYKNKLSHLSSCLTAAPIILDIYEKKRPKDKFVLSAGHAGLALYSVLEGLGAYPTAEQIYLHHGIHPDRCADCHLDCSTGSLGQGLPIALGIALADPDRDVYCLISDGECAEGSIWEALRIKTEVGANNLKVYANLNGFSAYKRVPSVRLAERLKLFDPRITISFGSNPPLAFLSGLRGHYQVMDEAQYQEALQWAER